jgi:hypothetical protein
MSSSSPLATSSPSNPLPLQNLSSSATAIAATALPVTAVAFFFGFFPHELSRALPISPEPSQTFLDPPGMLFPSPGELPTLREAGVRVAAAMAGPPRRPAI